MCHTREAPIHKEEAWEEAKEDPGLAIVVVVDDTLCDLDGHQPKHSLVVGVHVVESDVWAVVLVLCRHSAQGLAPLRGIPVKVREGSHVVWRRMSHTRGRGADFLSTTRCASARCARTSSPTLVCLRTVRPTGARCSSGLRRSTVLCSSGLPMESLRLLRLSAKILRMLLPLLLLGAEEVVEDAPGPHILIDRGHVLLRPRRCGTRWTGSTRPMVLFVSAYPEVVRKKAQEPIVAIGNAHPHVTAVEAIVLCIEAFLTDETDFVRSRVSERYMSPAEVV